MSFNWKAVLGGIFYAVPGVIQQVEQDHNDKGGLEKQKLAKDLIRDGLGLASAVAPAPGIEWDALDLALNGLVDGTVAIANAIGHFKHKPKPAEPPATAPPATTT